MLTENSTCNIVFSYNADPFTYEHVDADAFVQDRRCPFLNRVGGSWAMLLWLYHKMQECLLHKQVLIGRLTPPHWSLVNRYLHVCPHICILFFLCRCLPFCNALKPGGQHYHFFSTSHAFLSIFSPLVVTFPLSSGGAARAIWLIWCFSGKERIRLRKIGCWFLPSGKMCRGDILFLEGGDLYCQGGNFP